MDELAFLKAVCFDESPDTHSRVSQSHDIVITPGQPEVSQEGPTMACPHRCNFRSRVHQAVAEEHQVAAVRGSQGEIGWSFQTTPEAGLGERARTRRKA